MPLPVETFCLNDQAVEVVNHNPSPGSAKLALTPAYECHSLRNFTLLMLKILAAEQHRRVELTLHFSNSWGTTTFCAATTGPRESRLSLPWVMSFKWNSEKVVWLFQEQFFNTSSRSTWPEKARNAHMACVDLLDRAAASLLELE